MKKILSLLLAAAMLAVFFCGCSSQADPLIGSWTGQVDLAPRFNKQLEQADKELFPYWQTESFPMELTMTFRKDGTYTITVDRDKLNAALDALKQDMTDGFRRYLADMIAVSDKDMTVDELLQSLNISIEGQIEAALGADTAEEILREFACEGNFEVRDGRLYTSAGKNFAVNKNIYEPFSLSGDTLTLMAPVGAADTGIHPIVLKRNDP